MSAVDVYSLPLFSWTLGGVSPTFSNVTHSLQHGAVGDRGQKNHKWTRERAEALSRVLPLKQTTFSANLWLRSPVFTSCLCHRTRHDPVMHHEKIKKQFCFRDLLPLPSGLPGSWQHLHLSLSTHETISSIDVVFLLMLINASFSILRDTAFRQSGSHLRNSYNSWLLLLSLQLSHNTPSWSARVLQNISLKTKAHGLCVKSERIICCHIM